MTSNRPIGILTLVQRVTKNVFVQNVTFTFLVQIITLLLSVVSSGIIARWLGPEGKGLLSVTMAFVGLLNLLLSGGVGVANVYFTGSRRLDVPTLVANTIGLSILSTVLGMTCVTALVVTGWLERLVPGMPLWVIVLVMSMLPITLLNSHLIAILQGLQRIIMSSSINLAQGVLSLLLTLVLVVCLNLGLPGAILASVGAGIGALAVITRLLKREGSGLQPKWNFGVIRSMLSFGLRGYVGNLLQFFNYRLDVFIVNYFLGSAGVGIYSVSVALAELLWHFPNAVGFVIFPKATSTQPEVMNTLTPRVFRITLGLTALGALGLLLAGRPLIKIVFSETFITAYGPMLALLPGVVLLGGAKVLTNEIAGRGYPHYNSANSGLGFILTVVLDLVLIPRHGIMGAAFASSIAYTAVFLTAIGFYLSVSRRVHSDVM